MRNEAWHQRSKRMRNFADGWGKTGAVRGWFEAGDRRWLGELGVRGEEERETSGSQEDYLILNPGTRLSLPTIASNPVSFPGHLSRTDLSSSPRFTRAKRSGAKTMVDRIKRKARI